MSFSGSPINSIQAIKKGLSHLDTEVVFLFSSAYKGTPEGKNAAKNYTQK